MDICKRLLCSIQSAIASCFGMSTKSPHVVYFACILTVSFETLCPCHRYDFNEMVSGKTQLQLVQDEGQSHVMGDLDFKVRRAMQRL